MLFEGYVNLSDDKDTTTPCLIKKRLKERIFFVDRHVGSFATSRSVFFGKTTSYGEPLKIEKSKKKIINDII